MPALQAAQLAHEWGIKIYAIGIGGEQTITMNTPNGMRRIPVGGSFDEDALRQIAQTTGGAYYLADSSRPLVNVIKEIDGLERSAIKSLEYVNAEERFMRYAIAALSVLGVEFFLANLVFRSLP